VLLSEILTDFVRGGRRLVYDKLKSRKIWQKDEHGLFIKQAPVV
jgi:hypothetical protein